MEKNAKSGIEIKGSFEESIKHFLSQFYEESAVNLIYKNLQSQMEKYCESASLDDIERFLSQTEDDKWDSVKLFEFVSQSLFQKQIYFQKDLSPSV